MKAAAMLGAVLMVIAGAVASVASTPAVPPLTGPVVDTAGVIDAGAALRIEALAREVKSKMGAEIALLTIDTAAPLTAFDYGMAVLDSWKLGSADNDDGLLLLVAVKDREARFFQGYGLEGILPDGRLGAILDTQVVPAFRRGELGAGAYAGLRAAAEVIAENAGVTLDGSLPVASGRPPTRVDVPSLLLLLFVLIVISVIVAQSAGVRGGDGHPPIFRGGYGGGFGSGGMRRGGFGGGGFGGGGAGRSW